MSVDRTTYFVLGIEIRDKDKMKYINSVRDEGDPDRFQPPYTAHITMIADGMSGDYIVIGDVLTSFDKYDEGPSADISIDYLTAAIPEVYDEIVANFPDLQVGVTSIRLFAFNHFS